MLDTLDADLAKRQRHEVRNSLHTLRAACSILRRRGADPELLAKMEEQVALITDRLGLGN